MKKIILISAITISLALPMQAFASEIGATPTVEPGITPDSLLYPVDQVVEKIELGFVDDGVSKATELTDIAEERLAEAVEMIESDETDLAQSTLESYEKALSDLNDELDTAIETGENVLPVMEEIQSGREETEQVIEEVISDLPKEQQEEISNVIEEEQSELESTTEAVDLLEGEETEQTPQQEAESEQINVKTDVQEPLKKEIIKQAFISLIGEENVARVVEQGLNERQIVALISFSEKTGKTFEEVLNVFLDSNKGIGSTAKALDLTQKEALKVLNKNLKQHKKEIQQKFKEIQKGQKTNRDSQEDATDKMSEEINVNAPTIERPESTTDNAEVTSIKKQVPSTIEKRTKETKKESIVVPSKKEITKAKDPIKQPSSHSNKGKVQQGKSSEHPSKGKGDDSTSIEQNPSVSENKEKTQEKEKKEVEKEDKQTENQPVEQTEPQNPSSENTKGKSEQSKGNSHSNNENQGKGQSKNHK